MTKRTIKPIIPIWARQDHKVVRTWQQPVYSGDAAEGIGTFVEYLDKKGRSQTCMKWVMWTKTWTGHQYSN